MKLQFSDHIKIIVLLIIFNLIFPLLLAISIGVVFNPSRETLVLIILFTVLLVQVIFSITYFTFKLWYKILQGIFITFFALLLPWLVYKLGFGDNIYDFFSQEFGFGLYVLSAQVIFSLIVIVLWEILLFVRRKYVA